MNQWGLCRDEFVDNDNWPNQLYIRESRRMVGEYVVVQKDLQTDLTKPDPIGMGSYNSDSHNIQRIVDAEGFVRNEGDMQVAVKPYQIPYRVMLPKRAEARNLLVTGRLLGQPRRLLVDADGAAVHDHRPGRRGRREARDLRQKSRPGDRHRAAHRHPETAGRHYGIRPERA